MIGRLIREDKGVSLVELVVASLIAMILGALMLTWLVGVNNTREFQEQEQIALDYMRTAKARLVKELRFADIIDPGLVHNTLLQTIIFAVDGEVITWSIDVDGDLTRTDDDGTVTHARKLITATSGFTIDGSSVLIELEADVESAGGPSARSIRTEIQVRNA